MDVIFEINLEGEKWMSMAFNGDGDFHLFLMDLWF